MEQRTNGGINLALIASTAAAVAAVAAVITSAVVFWQVHQAVDLTRRNAGVESLWHMNDAWNSATMLDVRSSAAAALLAGQTNADVDEVLAFFQEVEMLISRDVVDEPLTAFQFYWPLANYWSASHQHALSGQGGTASAWEEMNRLVTRLGALEAARRKRDAADLLPTAADVQHFLTEEQGGAECSDDSDARKTPL